MRICYLTTTDLIVRFFLTEHIRRAAIENDVTLVVNTDDPNLLERSGIRARLVPMAIERDISPASDLKALVRLLRFFRREHFDLVHSIAPKAGLLGMMAAWFARVPVRLHTCQGEVWLTQRGIVRWLLRTIDRLTAWLATDLLVVSASERRFLIDEGIVSRSKSSVLGKGSISGVDAVRFRPDPVHRKSIRREFALGDHAILFLFLGRLKLDKGVLDLANAFEAVSGELPDVHLAFVGPDEDGVRPDIAAICQRSEGRVHFFGYTPHPEHFLTAADVLCLPSHREGFGMTIIEAAACGIPAMASDIYGITDALEDGVTGILHAPGDKAAIGTVIRRFATNAADRIRMGEQARLRVLRDFRMDDVISATHDFYRKAYLRAGGPERAEEGHSS